MRVLIILALLFVVLSAFPTTLETPKLRRRKTTTPPPPMPKLDNRIRMKPDSNFKDFFNRVEEFTKEKEQQEVEKSYVDRGFGSSIDI